MRALCGLAAAALLALAGCASSGAKRFSGGEENVAGGGGDLEVAVARLPSPLDPLAAASPSERLVIRQVYEPLVSRQRPPYGGGPSRRGVAFDWTASADLRVWSFRLRPGIRFADGSRLDAAAVAANATRWRTDPAGAALLPGLVAADAPNPVLARLIFASPTPGLPGRLADPRLGLVSSLSLSPPSGIGAGLVRPGRAGSGPFMVSSRGKRRLSLARFRGWWGTERRLGPALDRVVFGLVESPRGRAARLREGAVRVATELPPGVAAGLGRDPLLAVLAGGGGAIAYERSVKGLEAGGAQPLSGVWLALLQPGA